MDEMIGIPPPQTVVEDSTQIQPPKLSEQLCFQAEAQWGTEANKLLNYDTDTQRVIQEWHQFGLAGFVLGNILMFVATVYRLDRVFRRLWRARHASLDYIPCFVPACDESSYAFETDDSLQNAVELLDVQLGEPLASYWPTSVFKGHHVQRGRDVAIKILRKTPGHVSKKNLDIEALRRLSASSPHFIEFIDAIETEHHTIIVMEFCKRGSLSEILQKVVSDATYSQSLFYRSPYTGCMFKVLEIFVQIAHGLIELHRQALIHGKITPQNILLSDREIPNMQCCKPYYTQLSRVFCLTDFDVIGRMTGGVDFSTSEGKGTIKYRAPEILKESRVNGIKADTYSFGVMLYEALTSEAYADMKHVRTADGQDYIIEETFVMMKDLGGLARVPLYGWWSMNPAIISVLRGLLCPNPNERASLADFVDLFSANSVGQRDVTKTDAVPFECPPASWIPRSSGVRTVNWISEFKAEAESLQSPN